MWGSVLVQAPRTFEDVCCALPVRGASPETRITTEPMASDSSRTHWIRSSDSERSIIDHAWLGNEIVLVVADEKVRTSSEYQPEEKCSTMQSSLLLERQSSSIIRLKLNGLEERVDELASARRVQNGEKVLEMWPRLVDDNFSIPPVTVIELARKMVGQRLKRKKRKDSSKILDKLRASVRRGARENVRCKNETCLSDIIPCDRRGNLGKEECRGVNYLWKGNDDHRTLGSDGWLTPFAQLGIARKQQESAFSFNFRRRKL
ncbi:hypothetical protein SCHPADRAFT_892460 [Schizopora paradoxa]|uniref:Uncharacterized protein n=1 Tax=Schizopora paradoxa TaxID=27342 RepID=A0A0H2RZV4_9AGAM|nr:hypothetical protein SCHPADRAFT_892460 [Schizopora paradoxa]